MVVTPEELHVIGEIALAMGLGGLVGYEREQAQKPAGLRTHMLIAGAAALLVGLGDALVTAFAIDRYGDTVRADPIRIVEAVVTGIGLVGAGTIFRRGTDHVEGLTTAASLLMVGGIGIAVAIGQFAVAGAVTVLVLVALRGIAWLEGRMRPPPDEER